MCSTQCNVHTALLGHNLITQMKGMETSKKVTCKQYVVHVPSQSLHHYHGSPCATTPTTKAAPTYGGPKWITLMDSTHTHTHVHVYIHDALYNFCSRQRVCCITSDNVACYKGCPDGVKCVCAIV